MLSKTRRIDRADYPVGRPERFYKGSLSTIAIYSSNVSSARTRFSISVSKKVSKSAVVRNRIRRFGYRAIAEIIDNVSNGFLVRFSVQSVPQSYEEISNDMKNLVSKSGILKPVKTVK